PPHPLAALRAWRSGNPLPTGERVDHSSPQQSWRVFWHTLINRPGAKGKTRATGPGFDNP
ncbi:MAG: hypothetical protein WCO26_21700, partial [Deltaproteobacteria bacterium]